MAAALRARLACCRQLPLRGCGSSSVRGVLLSSQRRHASSGKSFFTSSDGSLSVFTAAGIIAVGGFTYYTFEKWNQPKSAREEKVQSYVDAGKVHPEAEAESMAVGDETPSGEQAKEGVGQPETQDAAAPSTSDAQAGQPAGLPDYVPYVLIGAGTASYSCMKAIRERDPDAKVLIIGEEDYTPYMRPPLSKALWLEESHENARQLKFTASWAGGVIDIFYKYSFVKPHELMQKEGGASAVLTDHRATAIDPAEKIITLSNGVQIKYNKCLIATGGKPRNLPIFFKGSEKLQSKVSLYRNASDFLDLDNVVANKKTVLVVGGGFLGSELAVGMASRGRAGGINIVQVFPEVGNLGLVLPKPLADWTTNKVRKEGVTVHPGTVVSTAEVKDGEDQVTVELSDGEKVLADHIVVAVGLQPDTGLASGTSGLEVDDKVGGYRVNSELQACSDVWVAGDVSSFYDPMLGRRRVEHHDHANVSGRLAGENMTGAQKQFRHQSMFWSDVGPDVGFEAVGVIDARLPTVGIWAKPTEDPPVAPSDEGDTGGSKENDYSKGVVFYLREKQIVGVLSWNCFGKMDIARKLISEGASEEDISKYAQDFDIHSS